MMMMISVSSPAFPIGVCYAATEYVHIICTYVCMSTGVCTYEICTYDMYISYSYASELDTLVLTLVCW